jgi:hypothetical protein
MALGREPVPVPLEHAPLQLDAVRRATSPNLRPNCVPTASWSLPRSLLFRGAVKRLDTPRNGQRIGTSRSRSSFKLVGDHPRSGRTPDTGQASERTPFVVNALQLSRALGAGPCPAGDRCVLLDPTRSGEEMAKDTNRGSTLDDFANDPSPTCTLARPWARPRPLDARPALRARAPPARPPRHGFLRMVLSRAPGRPQVLRAACPSRLIVSNGSV